MSAPCFKCGAAHSCRHRTVEPVIRADDPQAPKPPYISGGGRYSLANRFTGRGKRFPRKVEK